MSDSNFEEAYLITEEEYRKMFDPLYRRFFTPKVLIQFPVILPFHIPIPDTSGISIVVDDHIICTYIFSILSITEQTTLGNLDGKFVPIETRKSRVEMTYVTDEGLVWDSINLTAYFDVLVEKLNVLITAYLITMKDVDAHNISREMFQMASLCRFIQVDNWNQQHVVVFRLHNDVAYERPMLNEAQLNKISRFAHILQNNLNPFILSEEILTSARRHFKEGFYRETVIYAQTSVETFLSALYISILQQEGSTLTEAETARENTPFMSMIKKEFHPRIGGSWNVDNKRTKIGKWHDSTYLLRNQIAHGGYMPSFEKTQAALDAAMELRSYVLSLIRAKKKKYPTLQAYFV
jgi:hypothetical protein